MALHQKQIDILELLQNNQGLPLTLRDIMDQVEGLKSPSHVQHHLNQLEKKGFLKRNPSNPRDYKVLLEAEKPITYLNLYGMAKCGPEGTCLSGDPIDRIPVYSKLIHFDISEAFLVEASGDSMEPTIQENDLIIGQKNENPNNGDIVICTFNDKVYVKKIQIFDDKVLLESLNTKYAPMLVSLDDNLKVEGVMKGYIRSQMDTIKI